MNVPPVWPILAFAALLAGAWSFRRNRAATWPERSAGALLPAMGLVLLFAYVETAILNTHWNWSACRLAPSLGLFHGYPLYSPADSGPINGWLYGPVAALLWTPAALASSPQAALGIAAVINLLFLLGPVFAAGWRTKDHSRIAGPLAAAFGAAALLQVYPTWYMASALNVDAIAVGLGAGSCLMLLDETLSGQRLLLAASLGALAVWTKQTEAPLALAQFGWLWFVRSRQTALTFAAAWAGTMLVVTALVCVLLNPRDVFFNMWTVPAAHALPGGWTAAWTEIVDFCRYTWMLWLPGALALLARSRATGESRAPVGAGALRSPLLFLAAAAVLLPLGVMAAIKFGGDRNSMHSVYYLAIGTVLALAHAWSAPTPRWTGLVRTALMATALAGTLLVARQVAHYPQLTMLPPRCLSEEAWIFARQHPQQVYYPWDPLATLMADGRMYHFEYGVIDRIHAGRPPAAARMRHDLPAAVQTVIYPRADYSRVLLRDYLPEFSFANATEDWLIYRRKNSP